MHTKEHHPAKASHDESEKPRNIGAEISKTLEKIVSEKLGNLEEAFLLGNRIYNKSSAMAAETDIHKKLKPDMQAKTTIEKNVLEIGEQVRIGIELTNNGTSTIIVSRIENAIPAGFELVTVSDNCTYISNYLDTHGLKIEPNITENIETNLRTAQTGVFLIAPKILCTSRLGLSMTYKPEPMSVIVRETILPDRIPTGFQDLDNLLFGGIPENCAALLTSESCDEKELIIKRYLEASLAENCLTFHATIDPASVQSLADEFQDNFFALVCNPHGKESLENNSNVFRVNGVDNLTEINIALESVLKTFDEIRPRKGRACLEILSDVLLQHGAVQTRKWLSGLIPELRSRGLTTLGILNPFMHSSEELHSITSLFDGEISIYNRESGNDYTKYLRIKRMHRQKYLDSELPLKKTRLMTAPLRLSCCSRLPNL